MLSGCDRGPGERHRGEGLFGLRRAFALAGAETLILSLWSVDDRSTRDWMRALYKARFGDGLGSAEAVRTASLEVLRRRTEGQAEHAPLSLGGLRGEGRLARAEGGHGAVSGVEEGQRFADSLARAAVASLWNSGAPRREARSGSSVIDGAAVPGRDFSSHRSASVLRPRSASAHARL